MVSQKPEREPLTDRIERVEKQNRWLVAAVLLALVLGAAALLIYRPRRDRIAVAALVVSSVALLLGPGRSIIWKALGVARTLEAEKFVLRDANGKERAMLYSENGGASLWLSDGGICPLTLTQTLEGSNLMLVSPNGSAATLEASTRGVEFGLFGPNHEMQVSIGLDDNGPTVSLYGIDKKLRATLSVDEVEPDLSLWDADGKLRGQLSLDKAGPALSLWDTEGSLRAQLGLDDQGPSLRFYNVGGDSQVEVAATTDSANIWLFPQSAGSKVMVDADAESASVLVFNANGNKAILAPD